MLDLFRRKPRVAEPAAVPLDGRWRAAAGVAATGEGGRTVLLDPAAGEYYGLDEVATRVWELLGGGATLAQAVDALEAEYDAPRPVLEADARALVARLAALRLLKPRA